MSIQYDTHPTCIQGVVAYRSRHAANLCGSDWEMKRNGFCSNGLTPRVRFRETFLNR